jgi:ComEC/Rec2-related protein
MRLLSELARNVSKPPAPLFLPAVAAVCGIALADSLSASATVTTLWIAASGIALPAFFFNRTRLAAVFAVILCGFALWHRAVSRLEPDAWRLIDVVNRTTTPIPCVGVVATEPGIVENGSRFELLLETATLPDAEATFRRTRIQVSWRGGVPMLGNRVALPLLLSLPTGIRNPGEIDYASWLRRRDIIAYGTVDRAGDAKVLATRAGFAFARWAAHARQWVGAQLRLGIREEPEVIALIESMLLGTASETPETWKELFRTTGTYHLFAVSGLNVGMLGFILAALLRPFGIQRGAAAAVVIPCLAGYALLTGLAPSCVRACIMGALLWAGFWADRRPVALNAIAAAALLILAADPRQLFLPGFQFSFVLVLALVWFSNPLADWMIARFQPDPFLPESLWSGSLRLRLVAWRGFSQSLAVSLTAWGASCLFTAGYFHMFSPVTVLANLFAVPIAFALLSLGVASVLTAPLFPAATVVFNHAAWAGAKLLLIGVTHFHRIPGSHFYVRVPPVLVESPLVIRVLDVGDGAAVHIRSEGRDWLIDGGPSVLYRRTLLPALRSNGVNRLDGWLLTHGDSAHIGCGLPLLADFAPRLILDLPQRDRSSSRRAIQTAVFSSGQSFQFIATGRTFQISPNTRCEILFPPPTLLRDRADDLAAVFLIRHGPFSLLFLGDAGHGTEEWILAHYPGLKADCVVKGWHAADYGSATGLLAAAKPTSLILSPPTTRKARESWDHLNDWLQSAPTPVPRLYPHATYGAVTIRVDAHGAASFEPFLPDSRTSPK